MKKCTSKKVYKISFSSPWFTDKNRSVLLTHTQFCQPHWNREKEKIKFWQQIKPTNLSAEKVELMKLHSKWTTAHTNKRRCVFLLCLVVTLSRLNKSVEVFHRKGKTTTTTNTYISYILCIEKLVRWKISIEYCRRRANAKSVKGFCVVPMPFCDSSEIRKDKKKARNKVKEREEEKNRKLWKANGQTPVYTRANEMKAPRHSMARVRGNGALEWNGNGLGIKMFVKQERRHVDLVMFHRENLQIDVCNKMTHTHTQTEWQV